MDEFIKPLLDQGPLVVLLLLFLYGFMRGWWVFGREFDSMKKSAEEWKTLAERGTKTAERAAQTAEKLMPPGRRPTLEDVLQSEEDQP